MGGQTNVYEGMAQVIAALSYIPKGRSQGVSYEFRGIDAVMNALHGPLADAGLFLVPRVLDDWQVNGIPGSKDRTQFQALFRIECDVVASDGSKVTLGPGLAQSHDYGDKAVYQAQQNALKYLLLEAFCIPTAEQDMDAREADPSPQPATDPQTVAARWLSESPFTDDQYAAVCALYHDGATSTSDLTDDEADKLTKNLQSDKALAAIRERLEAGAA